MPIVATSNLKSKICSNRMEFKIEEIYYDEIKINNNGVIEDFTFKEFGKSFILAFCVAVYKYQGCDIDEHYNIHDIEKMDKNMFYTSLSRTKKFEYIHFNREN